MKRSAMVQEFHRYWLNLAGGHAPERHLFDPMAVPRLMPALHIVEMEEGSDRLRYRLVGTLSDNFNGMHITGHYLDEFFTGPTEESARFFDDIYRRIAQTALPEEGEYDWPAPTGLMTHIMFGVFPFHVDDAIRQFFYLEDFSDAYSSQRKSPWWVAPFKQPPL